MKRFGPARHTVVPRSGIRTCNHLLLELTDLDKTRDVDQGSNFHQAKIKQVNMKFPRTNVLDFLNYRGQEAGR